MAAYISEASYAGAQPTDFVEVAITAGTDVSGWSVVFYEFGGTVMGTVPFGSPDTTMFGQDLYVFDSSTSGFPVLSSNSMVALVDDTGTVVQFISFHPAPVTAVDGPAAGMTAGYVGSASRNQSLETTDDGATYQTQNAPNKGTIPCYAPGSLIDTPGGPRAVETLQPGDQVLTQDHGPQTIRWMVLKSPPNRC